MAVVLTACADEYAAIFGMSATSSEKSCRLLLAHIRDSLPAVSLSYLDAIFNVDDLRTKIKGSRALWRYLIESGSFRISFLGIKRAKVAYGDVCRFSSSPPRAV